MLDIFFRKIIVLKGRFRRRFKAHIEKEKAYVKKLIFPLKLFPLKLAVYFLYYPIRISWSIFVFLIKSFFKAIFWPFRKWSNLFKLVIWLVLAVYIFFSLLVIRDYLRRNYGSYRKFVCGAIFSKRFYVNKIVRIIGGYGQGSGFFIEDNKVITNFHVIDGEPSPKIIFPDGSFVTPTKVEGDKTSDIAVLHTSKNYPEMILRFMNPIALYEDEPLIAFGYALGTELKGEPTHLKGRFIAYRDGGYIQSDINLVSGMSGGPLFEQCGEVAGISTMGLSGLSMFISASYVQNVLPKLSEQDIVRIKVDPSTPEGAVVAFYTYLKARNMEEGFKLLSKEYLKKTNFDEWSSRFRDVLDVNVYLTRIEDEKNNGVFIKFSTKNWIDQELKERFYEGTWQTVKEDGIYKMLKSKINEVEKPGWDWFYD